MSRVSPKIKSTHTWHFPGADSDQVLLLQKKLAAMEEEKNYWKHMYFLMEKDLRGKIKEVNLKMRKDIEEVQVKLSGKETELLHLKAALMAKGNASRKTAPFMSTPLTSLQGKLDEVNRVGSVADSDSTGIQLSCQSDNATAEAQKEMNSTYVDVNNWIIDTVASSSEMESNGILRSGLLYCLQAHGTNRPAVLSLAETSERGKGCFMNQTNDDHPFPRSFVSANAERDDRHSFDKKPSRSDSEESDVSSSNGNDSYGIRMEFCVNSTDTIVPCLAMNERDQLWHLPHPSSANQSVNF